ncbi:MAG: TetR/AcrR family transcriptional regulator [Gemmatimonadaceae bacterium]
MKARPPRSHDTSPKERLLEAADRLFYQEGVRAVGIDRVLAEADVAKASLYQHFGCKDTLVAAYVERRATSARCQMVSFVERFPIEERAVRVFDWVVEWAESPGFRGCPLQQVVSELSDSTHPARLVASEQREWVHTRFTEWVTQANVRPSDVSAVVGALLVLFDGAVAATAQDGAQRARDARWVASQVVTTHLANR